MGNYKVKRRQLKEEYLRTTGGTLTGPLIVSGGADDNGTEIHDSTDYGLISKIKGNTHAQMVLNAELKLIQFNYSIDGGASFDVNELYGVHNVTAGTTDLTAGSSALAHDCYYDVYK